MMLARGLALAAACAAVLLAACGERPQSAESRRKSDTQAFQGVAATAYSAPGWKSGDAASWEQHLKARAQAQNEYARVGGR